MANTIDYVAEVRERVARLRSQPGYHPYWAGSPIVSDKPLWAI